MEEDLKTKGSKLVRLQDTKEVQKLLTSSGPLMIVVYAKWCGHCQAMFDTWRELSDKVNGKAKVYVIEADDYTGKDIKGYPSMRIRNGSSTKMTESRDVEGLENDLLGNSLGGKRRRTRRFRNRARKTAKRALRRHVALV